MKILLTGANGFLGSHLLQSLIEYHLVAITLRSNSNTSRIDNILETNKVKVLFTDQSSERDYHQFFKQEQIETIVHCATDYGRNGINFFKTMESNVVFPLKLAEIGLKYNLKFFINTDSYFNKVNTSYQALPNYSKTKKIFLESLKEIKSQNSNLKIINLRLEHIYGEYDNPDKFISYITNKMMKNETIDLTHGHQKRDFVYIKDVVEIYKEVIANIQNLKLLTEIEVGSGISYSLRFFVLTLCKELNSQSQLNFGAIDYRDDEIMNSVANNSLLLFQEKFSKEFTFKSIEDGIQEMIKKWKRGN